MCRLLVRCFFCFIARSFFFLYVLVCGMSQNDERKNDEIIDDADDDYLQCIWNFYICIYLLILLLIR